MTAWLGVLAFISAMGVLWGMRIRSPFAIALGAYLVAPHFGDNLLPQVPVFGGGDRAEALLLADFVALMLVAHDLRRRRARSAGVRAGLVLVGVAVLLPTVGSLTHSGVHPAWYFSVGNIVRATALLVWGSLAWSEKLRRELTWVFGLAVVSLSLQVFMAPYAADILGQSRARVTVPGWGNNPAGYFLAMTAGLAISSLSPVRRFHWLWRAGVAVVAATGAYATGTRLPLVLISLAVVVALSESRQSWTNASPALAVVVATILLSVVPIDGFPPLEDADRALAHDPITTALSMAGLVAVQAGPYEAGSEGFRQQMISLALTEIDRRPILGPGWGSWGYVGRPAEEDVSTHAHNGPLHAAAEGGIIAAVLLYGGLVLLGLARAIPFTRPRVMMVVMVVLAEMASLFVFTAARGAAIVLLAMMLWRDGEIK